MPRMKMTEAMLFAGALGLGAMSVPAAAQTQSQMNASASRGLQRADARLNRAYANRMNQLGGASRVLLRNAQRNWIAFRDAECAFQSAGARGGSAQPMVHAMCLQSLTEARTAQLEKSGQCEEGDIACNR